MGKDRPSIAREEVFTDFMDGSVRFIMIFDEQNRTDAIRGENDSDYSAQFFAYQGPYSNPTSRYPSSGKITLLPKQTITWNLPGSIDPDAWNWDLSFTTQK